MRFAKMQGTGNDFVVVDCFDQDPPPDPGRLATAVCRRRFGVGADGLILILPSQVAEVRMRIFNADGSEAQMCGNGLRCVVAYLHDKQGASSDTYVVETGVGNLKCRITGENETGVDVRVDMGKPVLEPHRIPTTLAGRPPLNVRKVVRGRVLSLSVVSMGNPHCVVFVKEPVEGVPLEELGSALETSHEFPERTNVEFVNVVSPNRLRARVWERGCGETNACGTGACAIVVAGALTGRTSRKAVVELPGGELQVEWAADDHVYMTGPATCVYHGELCRSFLRSVSPDLARAAQA